MFRKIGYGAMAISSILLLLSTSQKIIKQDNVALSINNFDETTINWRTSNFVLEFAFDEGFEIEKYILAKELPVKLFINYTELSLKFEKIFIEKVFKFGIEPSYEFYCYKK